MRFKAPNAMRASRAVPWVVALVAGASAFWTARTYLSEQVASTETRYSERFEMIRVVVAGSDLPAGTMLSAETLAIRAVPARFAPSDIIAEGESHRIEGRLLISAAKAGDPLREAGTMNSARQSLASIISKGRRAITIEVSDVNSLSGLLQVGDRIDLYFRPEPTASIRPLLQSIRVLATGASLLRAQPSAEQGDISVQTRQFGTITLDVLPEEAQHIVLAQASGELTAMLRGVDDAEPLRATPLTLAQVLGQVARRVHGGNPQRTVEMIVGGRSRGSPSVRAK